MYTFLELNIQKNNISGDKTMFFEDQYLTTPNIAQILLLLYRHSSMTGNLKTSQILSLPTLL